MPHWIAPRPRSGAAQRPTGGPTAHRVRSTGDRARWRAIAAPANPTPARVRRAGNRCESASTANCVSRNGVLKFSKDCSGSIQPPNACWRWSRYWIAFCTCGWSAGIPATASAHRACPVWNSTSGSFGSKRMDHWPLGRCRLRMRSALAWICAAYLDAIDIRQRQRLVAEIHHVLDVAVRDHVGQARVVRGLPGVPGHFVRAHQRQCCRWSRRAGVARAPRNKASGIRRCWSRQAERSTARIRSARTGW